MIASAFLMAVCQDESTIRTKTVAEFLRARLERGNRRRAEQPPAPREIGRSVRRSTRRTPRPWRRWRAGVSRAGVGGQKVPGAGDLDPAPIDGSKRVGRIAPASACFHVHEVGKVGRGPCSSPSRPRGRPVLEDRLIDVGGHLVPVAKNKMDWRRSDAARGAPISGRCRRGR